MVLEIIKINLIYIYIYYMSEQSLDSIEPSVGTRMFNFFGLLTLLHKLNGKIQICSPLSSSNRLSKSRLGWDGHKYSSKPIHLWFNGKLVVDNLFIDNIKECIQKCEFTIISLTFKYGEMIHINYIIIHNREAYRIEPYGHGQTHMDDMDTKLIELFNKYGIKYMPHLILEDFSERGLQTIGETDGVYKILFPGYCNTYVFIYIEEICKYHAEHPELGGIHLFRGAINDIDDKFSKRQRGYTENVALQYNRQLLSFQKILYDQLILSKSLFMRDTRGQQRMQENFMELQEKKLETKYYSPDRQAHELELYDESVDILYKLFLFNKDILTIYGIDFVSLYSSEVTFDPVKLMMNREGDNPQKVQPHQGGKKISNKKSKKISKKLKKSKKKSKKKTKKKSKKILR